MIATRLWALCALCVALLAALTLPSVSSANTLPDGRGYEMVTPPNKNGQETSVGVPSTTGNAVNWEAFGGCCGSTSAAEELFQSTRTGSGWTTTGLTPTPPNPLVGIFAEQAALWWSPDLSQTIYTTPASYAAGDNRPPAPGASVYLDLYSQNAAAPNSSMTWLSQGPFPGAGTKPFTATFDGAAPATSSSSAPAGNFVAFDTQEQLTPDATGLADLNTPAQFLYLRNVAAGTTTLINVTNTTLSAAAAVGDTTISVADTSAFAANQPVTIGTIGAAGEESDTIASVSAPSGPGTITLNTALVHAHASGAAVEALVSPDGAILGDGNWLAQGFEPADLFGTTTNAISSDGTKVFFESPPSSAGGNSSNSAEGIPLPDLFMRDLATGTTTPISNPALTVCGGGGSGCTGGAQYEGASQSGSLVFFTSHEGLGNDANTDNELYEFDTTSKTVTPLSSGIGGTADGNVVGVTAISNDGSHVYFVAEGVLSGANAAGAMPTAGQPNFYVFDTGAGTTTFIATLADRDVTSCVPSCSSSGGSLLASEPDVDRPAVPTADGTTLVFDSSADLTSQNPEGPTTTMAADTASGVTTLPVASTAGIIPGRQVFIGGNGPFGDAILVTAVLSPTELQLARGTTFSHSAGDSVEQLATYELYRYTTADGSITCISCTPAGVPETGPAGLGDTSGGTYGPAGIGGVPMSSDGSTIFFDTPDPLVAADHNTGIFATGPFGGLAQGNDVYEWKNGTVSLISDGTSTTGSFLGATTPSGNDVTFTTQSQLVSSDGDGYDDIYDARVGGGFPGSGPAPAPCADPSSCRPSTTPTVFFPVPGSATLISPNTPGPSFTVGSISAKQRRSFAKTGKLTLKVTVNSSGQVRASAFARVKGIEDRMSNASTTFFSPTGGQAKLKLSLDKAGRKALTQNGKLGIRLEVGYSQSSTIDVAQLTLKKKKAKKSTKKSKHSVRTSVVAPARGHRVRGA